MNGLALCSGIGGLELGLRAVVRGYRTVCHVEREAYAAALLVARMEDETLDQAPIWRDLETFEGGPFCGGVDIVTAGFPCQPFSQAGKRLGTEDPRWLWPHVFRIIREVRPRLVLLENVQGFARRGLDPVLWDLASEGFDAEWDLFSAAELGAPHLRRRWFGLAAHPDRINLREQSRRFRGAGWAGPVLSRDTGSEGPRSHTYRWGREILRGCGLLDEERPPLWDYVDRRDLWASRWAWDQAPEPTVCGVDDGVPCRVDRLRALGNAVVPQVAAHAFLTLYERLLEDQD